MTQEICVRIPPSPTGLLHVGTVRTTLYNYLFAKKQGGKIIFRFEDTDKERSKKEYEDNILNGLKSLGFSFDEGPFWQSQRTDIYRQHIIDLIIKGAAYFCFCTKEELEKRRQEQIDKKLPPRHECDCHSIPRDKVKNMLEKDEKPCIRLRVPKDREIVFDDLVRGEVKTQSKEISDFVIAKDVETPLYHLAVVVDDIVMGVTHVIRGEDHIPNTPKHILIFEALGAKVPAFAHLPLILNEDKTKLSKRKNRVSVDDFIADGILPEALINFLALLGWNTSDEKEIFSVKELIEAFDLSRVQKGGAVFDEKKLLWMNGVWIRQKTVEEFADLVMPVLQKANVNFLIHGKEFFHKALKMIQERMKKLSEAPELLGLFFKEKLEYSPTLFINEKMKVDQEKSLDALKQVKSFLNSIDDRDWHEEKLEEKLVDFIKQLGWKNGQLLWPMRVALTGEEFSPGVFELLDLFGKKESLTRIERGVEILET